MYFQAGDCLLFKCKKPKKIEIQKGDIFYKGVNHLHRLRGNFAIGKSDNGQIYIHSKGCEAFHDEHKSIPLPEGFFRLQIVKEYDHLLEESRRVID